jgi:hypothetical protein
MGWEQQEARLEGEADEVSRRHTYPQLSIARAPICISENNLALPKHFSSSLAIPDFTSPAPTNAMSNRSAVRTTYEVKRTIQPIYSGGSVALSRDGRILAACLGEDALLTGVTTGLELARIEGVRWPLLDPLIHSA